MKVPTLLGYVLLSGCSVQGLIHYGSGFLKNSNLADLPAELNGPQPDLCYRTGGLCNKAKLEAIAFAEAVAEAHIAAGSDAYPRIVCYAPGKPCSKAKRDALAAAEALAEAEAKFNLAECRPPSLLMILCQPRWLTYPFS